MGRGVACKLICNGEKSNNFWPAPTAKKRKRFYPFAPFLITKTYAGFGRARGTPLAPGRAYYIRLRYRAAISASLVSRGLPGRQASA